MDVRLILHLREAVNKGSKNHPHFVQGIGRDGELAPVEQFVCHLYGTPEQPTVENARLQAWSGDVIPTRHPRTSHRKCQLSNKNLAAGRPGAHVFTSLLPPTSLHGRWSQTA